jgi:hypothetical protein
MTALPTVQRTLLNVRAVLQDAEGFRWSDATLIEYLNQGALEIARRPRSDAASTRATVTLETDSALHDVLPADAIGLIDVVRNIPSNAAVLEASLLAIGTDNRNWMGSTPEADILNWLQHPTEPTRFYSYPRAAGSAQVEVIYARVPPRMILREFTAPADVDTGLHTLTIAGHGLSGGERVLLPRPTSPDALPGNVPADTVLYVIVDDPDTLALALAPGQGRINFSSAGSGVLTVDSVLSVLAKYQFPLQLFVAGNALLEDKPEADTPRGERYLNTFYAALGGRG